MVDRTCSRRSCERRDDFRQSAACLARLLEPLRAIKRALDRKADFGARDSTSPRRRSNWSIVREIRVNAVTGEPTSHTSHRSRSIAEQCCCCGGAIFVGCRSAVRTQGVASLLPCSLQANQTQTRLRGHAQWVAGCRAAIALSSRSCVSLIARLSWSLKISTMNAIHPADPIPLRSPLPRTPCPGHRKARASLRSLLAFARFVSVGNDRHVSLLHSRRTGVPRIRLLHCRLDSLD